ncbi:PREDICTED: nudix hydrolase 24, chloroplastic [Nicrophorus vespilloides]|uniref:Nudix hydrolase 24, chloroplastic n=1 Tax=Nicrophorus vespilloides TaxID=110193 RepID=A0ABM1N0Y4_NICVS|nr:PREDICTED: nudix hydrolase 24, chloroplastic [Nicrophorus vespilloides]
MSVFCKMSLENQNISRLMKLAQKFNCFYLSGLKSDECIPFIVEGFQVGLVKPDVIKQLVRFPEVFKVTPVFVELNPAFREYEERTNKVNDVLKQLRCEGKFIALKGWRDECYEVRREFNTESLLRMDRSATCLFGIRNYGVDINGYVKHPNLGLCIWMQQRSATKQTWPGKWDNIISGGLSVGHGILETAHKEAMEEASVPPELMKNLISAGCVSFYFESERGLFPNTEFVYDLELPLDFVPQNQDGEVEKFELLPVTQCVERLFSPDFKTTSIPVILDFLIRHGLVSPENEPYYTRIIELLHVPLQMIYNNHKKKTNKENGQSNFIDT